MTRRLFIIVAIVTSGGLVAAGQTTTDQTSTTQPTSSTQSAASQTGAAPAPRGPLMGEYVGILMCVDCNAVRAKLTMFTTSPLTSNDGTYLFEQSYLSSHYRIEQTLTRGRWHALHGSGDDAGATVYQLDADPPTKPQYYLRVSDDVLRLLDQQRRELPSVINTSLTRLPRPGGYIGIDPYGPDVQQAAAFAVTMWSMRSPNPPTLRAITRAERQIVEGVNYKLCLDVDVAETRQRVQTVVYRDTAQTLHLTQWLAEGCEVRTLR